MKLPPDARSTPMQMFDEALARLNGSSMLDTIEAARAFAKISAAIIKDLESRMRHLENVARSLGPDAPL